MLGFGRDNSTVAGPLVPFNGDTIVNLIESEGNDGESKEGVEVVLWRPVASKE